MSAAHVIYLHFTFLLVQEGVGGFLVFLLAFMSSSIGPRLLSSILRSCVQEIRSYLLQPPKNHLSEDWVAVKELKLSYHK